VGDDFSYLPIYDDSCRDGRRRLTTLVRGRDATGLLGSNSLRGVAVGGRGSSSHARLLWTGVRRGGGCSGGERVGTRRSVGDASDSRMLTEYSQRPACNAGGRRETEGTPTRNAACACGVGSSSRVDATGCACGTGPAAARAAAGLERMGWGLRGWGCFD
jgi:hypothetical protein